MSITDARMAQQDDLIARLASHDIRYLDGGDREPAHAVAPLEPLLLDLARAPSSRVRDGLIALLLRHQEYAPRVEDVARRLPPDDPDGRRLLLALVIAAALYSEWSFTLDLYLPQRVPIRADHLAEEFGLPSPSEDFGRPCLAAATRMMGNDHPFPINYQADWEHAAHRLISQLIRGTPP